MKNAVGSVSAFISTMAIRNKEHRPPNQQLFTVPNRSSFPIEPTVGTLSRVAGPIDSHAMERGRGRVGPSGKSLSGISHSWLKALLWSVTILNNLSFNRAPPSVDTYPKDFVLML